MSQSVRVVERALDILLCFTADNQVLSLSQIAGQLNIPKSSVHRLLATLEGRGVIRHDKGNGMYRLGLRFIDIPIKTSQVDLVAWAHPHLQELAGETEETVELGVLDGADIVFLEVIESPQRLKLASARGERVPAFCTATGRVFLAYLAPARVHEILARDRVRYTAETHISTDEIYQHLDETCERGFAMNEGEYEDGINVVAAPVLNGSQEPIAALAVAGPAVRLSRERMLALGPRIRSLADDIAHDLMLAHLAEAGKPDLNARP